MTDSPVDGPATTTDGELKPALEALEPLIEAELEATNETDLDRRSTHPLDLPGLIVGVLTDIRTIAEGMALLPKLLGTLNSIDSRVDALNEEVHLMRMRVNQMEGNVDDVTRALHPLRRLGDRARRPENEQGEPET